MAFSLTASPVGAIPQTNELELSVFGPGLGECIVMHCGAGDWIVIDSCKHSGSAHPVAIEYLEALGLDPSTAVRAILATHWHDDHVRGLAKLVRRCPDATFAISAALEPNQFYGLVFEVEERNKLVNETSTAREFAEILDHFLEVNQHPSPSVLAQTGSILFRGGINEAVTIQALSPSTATVVDCGADLVSKLCTAHPTRKFRRTGPNDLSVAVQVSAGPVDLLLKADLEDSSSKLYGWKAVLEDAVRPTRSSAIVKVGHHGSPNADNSEVWVKMVEADPVCIVTPYTRGHRPLPHNEDIARLKTHTSNLFITSSRTERRNKHVGGINRQIKAATKVRRALPREPGFVRLRLDLTSESPQPNVELFGSAKEL